MNELKQNPEFSHIGIVMRHVNNLDQIRAFYVDVLGMKPMWQSPKTGSTGLKTGNNGGPTFILDSKQSSPDSLVEFNFETPDVAGAHQIMKENHIQVGDIKAFGDGSALFHFQDPDGYTLMVWGADQNIEK